jgi:hypothetical protein
MGWSEGRAIGRNVKEEVKAKELVRWADHALLGMNAMPPTDGRGGCLVVTCWLALQCGGAWQQLVGRCGMAMPHAFSSGDQPQSLPRLSQFPRHAMILSSLCSVSTVPPLQAAATARLGRGASSRAAAAEEVHQARWGPWLNALPTVGALV